MRYCGEHLTDAPPVRSQPKSPESEDVSGFASFRGSLFQVVRPTGNHLALTGVLCGYAFGKCEQAMIRVNRSGSARRGALGICVIRMNDTDTQWDCRGRASCPRVMLIDRTDLNRMRDERTVLLRRLRRRSVNWGNAAVIGAVRLAAGVV